MQWSKGNFCCKFLIWKVRGSKGSCNCCGCWWCVKNQGDFAKMEWCWQNGPDTYPWWYSHYVACTFVWLRKNKSLFCLYLFPLFFSQRNFLNRWDWLHTKRCYSRSNKRVDRKGNTWSTVCHDARESKGTHSLYVDYSSSQYMLLHMYTK